MKTQRLILIILALTYTQVSFAGGSGVHKYWVCAISSYYSLAGGERREGRCRANTAYSEPPCREFVVEFEGDNGVRPGNPYDQKTVGGSTTRIEINKADGGHAYTHTVTQYGGDKRVYLGKCDYFEAPAKEKIHMDHGLTTAP